MNNQPQLLLGDSSPNFHVTCPCVFKAEAPKIVEKVLNIPAEPCPEATTHRIGKQIQ
jgi:hypothetical protein